MKKAYIKPYLAVESFQLDAAIAASCSSEGRASLGFYMNTCTLDDDKGDTSFQGLGYFGIACAENGGYDIVNFTEGGDANDGICYHGPVSTDMFMNS